MSRDLVASDAGGTMHCLIVVDATRDETAECSE
jgi:hypothetical protein